VSESMLPNAAEKRKGRTIRGVLAIKEGEEEGRGEDPGRDSCEDSFHVDWLATWRDVARKRSGPTRRRSAYCRLRRKGEEGKERERRGKGKFTVPPPTSKN